MGEYIHVIDAKNRIFIPAKFRVTEKNKKVKQFIITRGLDGCLYVYLPEMWNSLSEKFKNLPIKNKIAGRAFKRAMLSGASEAYLDEQGRILIPQHLTQYAQIKRDVVFIGVMDHAELWSFKRWQNYKKFADASFKRLSPQLEI